MFLVMEWAAAREFDHLLATRGVSHLCHVFSRRDILFCLRREKPVLQEGIICFNRLSYGILYRQASEKKPSFRRENMVECPGSTCSAR